MQRQRTQIDPAQARRVELILQQLDELPTLSSVAVRLLQLTTSDDTDVREVIELVSSDPSLSGKVLTLCRRHERGRASDVTTIERAVLLLGFDALRSAVLSVQVFEVFDRAPSLGGESLANQPVFNRVAFWQHSLAVASLSKSIASGKSLRGVIEPGEAFLAGLLHDLGMLAVHLLLPASLDGVCRFSQTHGVSLDQACHRIIGLDTHTAGRQLAAHWQLPPSISDVLWLHGQPYDRLPDVPHRQLIGVISLADILARQHYITPAGHAPQGESPTPLAEALNVPLDSLDAMTGAIHDQVRELAEGLGLNVDHDETALLRSIGQANEALGRSNTVLRKRARLVQRQGKVLQAIASFHDTVEPGQSIVDTLGAVVQCCEAVFGGQFFATLYQEQPDRPWELILFKETGRVLRSAFITPPPASPALDDLAGHLQVSMRAMAALPWVSEHLCDVVDVWDIRLMPLRCPWGLSAILLHDGPIDPKMDNEHVDAISATWGAAVAAAARHGQATTLGEELAQANRALVETEHSLARSRTLAAVGEIAAGAAHEMNNPLTIISGRSQLLVGRLRDPETRLMAEQIAAESHRLSDMISALRSFAEPLRPKYRWVDLPELVFRVVQPLCTSESRGPQVSTILPEHLAPAWLDPEMLATAVTEIVQNAVESAGTAHIELRVQTDPLDDRLKIQAVDDGAGLSQQALAHAFDPFFSAKAAGRQPGLGLARARRIIEAHGGCIELANGPSGGAIATIWLDGWRGDQDERRDVA